MIDRFLECSSGMRPEKSCRCVPDLVSLCNALRAVKTKMGNCVSPETDEASFSVWNVDDGGNRVQPGKMFLTETHLVFAQKGVEPIRWPMSGLRRYGFDAELFSFESGRRCPTGSGVYAFKCFHAERLFNLLQERIQAQAPMRPSSVVDSPPSPEMRATADYLEPISLGAQVVSSVNFVNNVDSIPPLVGPVYQNVPVSQGVQPSSSSEISSQTSNTTPVQNRIPTKGVNYVLLDLDQPSEPPTPTSPVSPTYPIPTATSQSSLPPMGYAQIDFDKTLALQQIANRQRTES